MNRVYLALALVLTVVISAGCSQSAGPSAWELVINGPGGDKVVRIEDIKKMDQTTLDVEVKDEARQYTGVRLSVVLKSIDITTTSEVTLEAADGYTATISGAAALSDNTILAYQLNGKDLSEKSAPLMLVTTEDSTQTWVGQLKKVVIK